MVCAVMAVALTGGFALQATAEEQQSVAGEWTGNYARTDGRRIEFYMTLRQDGERVTGEFSTAAAGAQLQAINSKVSGTFKDGVFVWGTNFKGTVTGDTMAGMLSAQGGRPVNFTAVRTKK